MVEPPSQGLGYLELYGGLEPPIVGVAGAALVKVLVLAEVDGNDNRGKARAGHGCAGEGVGEGVGAVHI